MSSPTGWCVHASATRTRSPAFSRSIPAVPRTISTRSPWKRAKRMEKEVRRTPGGVSSATCRNACESVTTSRGGAVSRARAVRSSCSLHDDGDGARVEEVAERLDLGQDDPPLRGLGVDRRDEDDEVARARRGRRRCAAPRRASAGAAARSACAQLVRCRRPTWRPSRRRGPRGRRDGPRGRRRPGRRRPCSGRRRRGGRARGSRRGAPPRTGPTTPASATRRARSVRSSTLRVFAIRCSPSAPSSSMPAVSTKRTGPSGRNSIGFSTGSVVVPGVAETMATCCRVRAFRTLDLPTLRRPKRPMWVRRLRGAVFIPRAPQQ